ncbi:MAG: hypothetical protein QMC85_00185 [Methanocellales archaeon]|nr:hypothetical protein [Methanocellales archaeon]MDI6858894.1 hypothetical protein [Methanocellales archaeon]MDI6903743.1 hypothetical protein [Methanocellales archaeon]
MKRKCPNCGANLEFILDEWICAECEYHEVELKKEVEESFR